MTTEEVGRLIRRVAEQWPGAEWDESAIQGLGKTLADVPGGHVNAALESYIAEGARFAPTAGQLWRRATEMRTNAPDWETAYAELRRLGKAGYMSPYYGYENGSGYSATIERCTKVMKDWPDILRNFVQDMGRTQLVEDLTHTDNGQARLREKYRVYVERAIVNIRLAGIEGADDLPRVQEARRQAPRHLGETVKRIAGELGPGS